MHYLTSVLLGPPLTFGAEVAPTGSGAGQGSPSKGHSQFGSQGSLLSCVSPRRDVHQQKVLFLVIKNEIAHLQ